MKTLAHVLLGAGTSLLVFLFLEAVKADRLKEPVHQGPAPGYDET